MGNSTGNGKKKHYENKPEWKKKRGAEISGENKEQVTQEK